MQDTGSPYLEEQNVRAVPADEDVLLNNGLEESRRQLFSSMVKETYTVRAVSNPAVSGLGSGLVVLNVRCAVDA